jgi:hypothetical protein
MSSMTVSGMKSTLPYLLSLNQRIGSWRCGMDSINESLLISCNQFVLEYATPISRIENDELLKFKTLATQWVSETESFSSISQISMNSSYQRIIGMGKPAVPFILDELETEPNHWFWALYAILGVNPVRKENRGRIKQMAEDWLNWARDNGYEWKQEA